MIEIWGKSANVPSSLHESKTTLRNACRFKYTYKELGKDFDL